MLHSILFQNGKYSLLLKPSSKNIMYEIPLNFYISIILSTKYYHYLKVKHIISFLKTSYP